MKSFGPGSYALSGGAALALLAGCGASQQPIGATGTAVHRSWMLQGATNGDLVYASTGDTDYGPAVYVYSYPGGELVGKLVPFASGYYPRGLCTDSVGDVFVTAPQANNSSQSYIYEYAHGGTDPVATLSDPGFASGCAVDPTTGNLAVANYSTTGPGIVAIYPDARGTPTLYSDSNTDAFDYCTYDNQGDLFATGLGGGYYFALFELPEGGDSFADISLSKFFWVGSIQWTGRSLAAAAVIASSRGKQPVYQIKISGSTGKVSGPTLLWSRRDRKNEDALQFWVQGGTIVDPRPYYGGLEFWRYPKGGRPTKVIGGPRGFYGVAVSVAHDV
jgi:hypothetical protein